MLHFGAKIHCQTSHIFWEKLFSLTEGVIVTMSRVLLAKYKLKNGIRAFRRWMIPYAQSRIYRSGLRPVLSYLFTDWKCNIDCHYCFQFNNKGESMSLETAISSIDWLKTVGCQAIAIMGGEPLVRKDFILNLLRFLNQQLML